MEAAKKLILESDQTEKDKGLIRYRICILGKADLSRMRTYVNNLSAIFHVWKKMIIISP